MEKTAALLKLAKKVIEIGDGVIVVNYADSVYPRLEISKRSAAGFKDLLLTVYLNTENDPEIKTYRVIGKKTVICTDDAAAAKSHLMF